MQEVHNDHIRLRPGAKWGMYFMTNLSISEVMSIMKSRGGVVENSGQCQQLFHKPRICKAITIAKPAKTTENSGKFHGANGLTGKPRVVS